MVVVADQRDVWLCAQQIDAFVRIRPLANHIPQTPKLIPLAARIGKHRFKRGQIGMNIRENKDPHGATVLCNQLGGSC